jgi:hypothetical protein
VGGAFHVLPEDFELPLTGILSILQCWYFGNADKGYPPLKNVSNKDVPGKNMKKKFSELRFLVNCFEDEAKRVESWIENPSLDQFNQIFSKVLEDPDCCLLPTETITNRKRRISQTKWTTAAKDLRKIKKVRRD